MLGLETQKRVDMIHEMLEQMEEIYCKRKTSCVFSSDNPSFIMITYILLYFSCRTGSAFD